MDTNELPMRIVVADDHALVRGGVGILIKILYPDTQLVECNSYEKTIAALTGNEDVDLLLLDLLMPGMGIHCQRSAYLLHVARSSRHCRFGP